MEESTWSTSQTPSRAFAGLPSDPTCRFIIS